MAEVVDIVELNDGSAEVTLELTKEEVRLIIQDTILRLLKEFIEKNEE